jgi:hypothetical protein
LQMASVLGRRFSVEELAALVDRSPPALLGTLHAALDAGLIVEDGDLLGFRHDLVREAVDASLPKAMRRSLRRRAVDVMLAHGAPPSEVAELVMEVAQMGDQRGIALLRQAAAEIGRVSPTARSTSCRQANRVAAFLRLRPWPSWFVPVTLLTRRSWSLQRRQIWTRPLKPRPG